MNLHHVGIVNDKEEHADRFYGEFLGLKRVREYIVSPELSEQLFSIKDEIKAIVYEGNGIRIEVFIYPGLKRPVEEIRHIGIVVDDKQAILNKTEEYRVEYIIGKTKDKTVHFIRDFSGNLIEIKQE